MELRRFLFENNMTAHEFAKKSGLAYMTVLKGVHRKTIDLKTQAIIHHLTQGWVTYADMMPEWIQKEAELRDPLDIKPFQNYCRSCGRQHNDR